nr:MAG TPA: hypothetical protein [Caudoviricetes sp.]
MPFRRRQLAAGGVARLLFWLFGFGVKPGRFGLRLP